MNRRNSKVVKIGNTKIGGDNSIPVQSMLNVPSYDLEGNIRQAKILESSGCEILRVAVPNMEAVNLVYLLKENIKIPIVADIHFNYKLAIESIVAGADKIRINPGNIGDEIKIKDIVKSCHQKNIPIRIGVNAGSLEKNILNKYGKASPEALCESAMYNVSLLEKFDFYDIVISIKSSSVQNTVEAYKMVANKCNYPLHIGVTETGTEKIGIIKSAIGIGSILLDGIGDTIRVSLTGDPLKEIETGINILKSVGLYKEGIDFIACPTCGRTRINIIALAHEAEKRLKGCKKKLKIAIMGCIVNGPGEASDADIGICGGNGIGIIFKKGKEVKRVAEEYLIDELVKEVELL